MSTWHDLAQWNDWSSASGCPVCNPELYGKPESERAIADLEISSLLTGRDTCMKGHCCLVVHPHAVEIFDLAEADAYAFMRDMRLASRALQEVMGAIKINYEIHGNTIPHLHLHLWPRQIGDRFEGGPIDWRVKMATGYTDEEFAAFIMAMQQAVRRLAPAESEIG